MIKKLFYLFSFGMIAYTAMIMKMRPGQMFKIKKKGSAKVAKESPVISPSSLGTPRFEVEEHMKVILRNYSGDVTVQRGEDYLDLKKGLELRYKDKVVTRVNSVAILKFAGNSIAKVFSNSEFLITKIQNRNRSDANLQYNIFHLNRGALLVDFVNQGKMHFLEMTTEAAKIQVRGTQYLFIHNQPKERTQLAVLEGIVKISVPGQSKTKFVMQTQGIIAKKGIKLAAPIDEGWVKKINWKKLAKGSGIDLYNPHGTVAEIDDWKRRRNGLKRFSVADNVKSATKSAGKTKGGGFIKSVVGKVLEVGGDIAQKGTDTLQKVSPVGKVGKMNEAAESMQNFEQAQKDRMKDIDSIDE